MTTKPIDHDLVRRALQRFRYHQDALLAAYEEIGRLRVENSRLSREIERLRASENAIMAALDAGGVPREDDYGCVLPLIERVQSALPALPAPMGAWRRRKGRFGWQRLLTSHLLLTVDGGCWTIRGTGDEIASESTAEEVMSAIRLALGPEGAPPAEDAP